jgi:hypothetical protein
VPPGRRGDLGGLISFTVAEDSFGTGNKNWGGIASLTRQTSAVDKQAVHRSKQPHRAARDSGELPQPVGERFTALSALELLAGQSTRSTKPLATHRAYPQALWQLGVLQRRSEGVK